LVFPFSHKVFSEQETENLAAEFSSLINPGDLIVLNGNLGTGKTFFIKNVLRTFNINGVSSPTFALVNEYYGAVNFYHFDFYRIEKINELYDIGFDEYMKDDETIKFIEWGNLFPSILPRRRIEIEIVQLDDLSRDFYFNNYE
jgi:tRNA threonylcarbamoyladenosine biosynthesis protein TsaE